MSTFCTCLDEFGANPPDDPCALHEPEPTTCPNGEEDCPDEFLCRECWNDGKDQASIDAEDARNGR